MSEFSPPPPLGRIKADGTAEITPRDLEAISAWLQQNNISRTSTTDTITTTTDTLQTTIDDQTVADLADTTITSVADNEVLAYDSSSSKWINQTAAEATLVTLEGEELLSSKTLLLGASIDAFAFSAQSGPPFTTASNVIVTNLNADTVDGVEMGEFAGINTQTGTTYTLVLTDKGKVIEMNNSSSNTCTVPPNSSVAFPVGSHLLVLRYGSGSTTIVAGSGVTLRSRGSGLAISAQYGVVEIYKRATDEWVVYGDI